MKFKITNRKIKCDYDSFSHLIGDNADYKAIFTFDEEWEGHIKTARFIHSGKYVDVILENDECNIPVELLKKGNLKVGVYTTEMTTTPCEVFVKASIKQENGTAPGPTQDVYAQIINMLENINISDEQIEKAVEKYMAEHPVIPPVVTLESVIATKENTEYNEGDIFDSSDIIVTAYYSNGTTKDVTSSANIDTTSVNMNEAGTYNIGISYTENDITKTTSINITVNEVIEYPVVPQTGKWQLKNTTGKKYIVLGTDDDNMGNAKYFRLLRTYNFPYTMNTTSEAVSSLKSLGSDVDDTIFTDTDAPALFENEVDVVTFGKYLYDSGLGEVAQHGNSNAGCYLWDSNKLTGDILTSLHTTYTEAGGTKTEEELRTALMELMAGSDIAQGASYVENSRTILQEALGFPIYTVGIWGAYGNPVVDGITLNISNLRTSEYTWREHNYLAVATELRYTENKTLYDLPRVAVGVDDVPTYIDKIQPDKVCEFYWHMPFSDEKDISKWRTLFDYIKNLVDTGKAEVVTRKQYAELGEYVDNPITSISIERSGSISLDGTDTDDAYVVTATFEDGTTSTANADAIIDRSAVNTSEEGSYTVYAYYRGFRANCNVAVASSYTIPDGLKDKAYWFIARNETQNILVAGNTTGTFGVARYGAGVFKFSECTSGKLNGWVSTDNGTTWTQVTTNITHYQSVSTNDASTGFNFGTVANDVFTFIETSGNFVSEI